MNRSHLLTFAVLIIGLSLGLSTDEPPRPAGDGRRGGARPQDGTIDDPRFLFRTDVPAHPLDVVLGRPTAHSVTAKILSYTDREGVISYGAKSGAPATRTRIFPLKAGDPVAVELTGLSPDAVCYYILSTRDPGGSWKSESERSFQTQRAPGVSFTFTVQADSHLDYGIEPAIYEKSLAQVRTMRPDFHIDLGDTFMVDKRPSYTLAAPQYLAQRYYFGLVGHSVPVFLVLGNHDGETLGQGRRGEGEGMATWSNAMRKRYFANPVPNEFYSGNVTPHPEAGLLEDYYAWTWGDALFIVLDQFWFSERSRKDQPDNWNRTLGQAQYEWLRQLLEKNPARYTFIFTHHLVGGETPEGRGGVEASRFFEWGGHEFDGRDTFAEKRPGWLAPIHDLLARRGGCVVFHGHDHLYVHAERDGVVYQLVPQPGHSRSDNTRTAAEYGYRGGVIQGASGILRIRVAPENATVDYVRAYPAAAEDATHRTGTVSASYAVKPR